jgi:hypothetical protein
MPLQETPRFNRATEAMPSWLVEAALIEHRDSLNAGAWIHCGYADLPWVAGINARAGDVETVVDSAFRMSAMNGFEYLPTVVTTGLRTSRFAPILFWEVLHALAAGGTWIDIDDRSRCGGTALIAEDFPEREYFRGCLRRETRREHGPFLVQTFRKFAAAPLAARINDDGWTFGILTSGSSSRAADMAAAILDLDLPDVEVIFCGPRPGGVPDDDRVRTIDLERPEPRGWITKKKNLIASAARHENLCLLHDRYVVTPSWADALKASGPCFSFLTLPQVYYAGIGHRFPQRYPDYQLLDQQKGLERALELNIYDSDRIFHPEYDDFGETAFCCGGLYITKRSLWNLVRQDEALFHCEWEDISFGLDCQRRGLPHRVNRSVTVESTAAHPLLLTRLHSFEAPARRERGKLHIVPGQESAAGSAPNLFKPVIGTTRALYYETTCRRFNAISGLDERDRLTPESFAACAGLSDFWAAIERHVNGLTLSARDQIAQVAYFLSDTVYKWPPPQVLSWIRAHERALSGPASSAQFPSVVGWGTGSAFLATHRLIGRDLLFVVDSDPLKWGSVVDGVTVRPPSAIAGLDPAATAVVVFSCFVEEIAALVRAEGPFAVLPAASLVAARRFRPLADLVAYFQEIERYYPVLFTDAAVEKAA